MGASNHGRSSVAERMANVGDHLLLAWSVSEFFTGGFCLPGKRAVCTEHALDGRLD